MLKKMRTSCFNLTKVSKVLIVPVLFFMAIAMASCSDEGPAERAGKKVDEAVEETGDTFRKAGEKVDETVDETKDKMKEAAEETGDILEKAGDKIEEAADKAEEAVEK